MSADFSEEFAELWFFERFALKTELTIKLVRCWKFLPPGGSKTKVVRMRALVIGGTRFLGKALVEELIKAKFEVSVLNLGSSDVVYGGNVERIKADRHQKAAMDKVLSNRYWDVVYDLICQSPQDALENIENFKDKTHKLIFLSSSFVYSYGQNIHEEQFSAKNYAIPAGDLKSLSATESRRVIEAIHAQKAPFKTLAVRMPFIFGLGDPTQKLKKMIKQVLLKEPMYLPNRNAKVSVIHVDDAAKALLKMALYPYDGAVNCAAALPLQLSSLIKMIEDETYGTARFSETASPETMTSLSIKSDWFIDTAQLKNFDITIRNHGGWLPALVKASSQEVYKERA